MKYDDTRFKPVDNGRNSPDYDNTKLTPEARNYNKVPSTIWLFAWFITIYFIWQFAR